MDSGSGALVMIVSVKPSNFSDGFIVEFSDGRILNVPNSLDNSDFQRIQAWLADGNTLDPLDLGPQIVAKKQEFIIEAVSRIATQVPEWNTFEMVAYTVSIANLLNLGSMNAAQTLARDIYLFTKNTALSRVAAVTTQAELDTIDPTAADPFGDGTNWPV